MLNSGRRGKRASDGYGILSVNENFNQKNYPIPIINSWSITDGSYNPTSATALSTAGGETVVVYGSGFTSGVTVNINGTNVSPVTLLDQGRITFTSPALASASYTMYVSNTDGATAIYVPGLVYSGVPNWSSPAAGTIGAGYETKSVNTLSANTFVATGDVPLTYSIVSGNLPSGVTLSSSGALSGTLPATASPTTYSFTIRAYDAQMQTSDRSFSLTINPDAVTWVTPTLNGSLTVYETQQFSTPLSATSAAGYGVMYAANTLPTGISLTSSNGAFSGYANTVGTTYAQLTATANTTGRYATSNVTFTVNQDVVTWGAPANNTVYTLNQGNPIANVTLSANSAAGYGVQYAANALPTGLTLSGSTISGTPTSTGTIYTQLTATADTTGRFAYSYISWTVNIAADTYFNTTSLLLSANNTFQTTSFITDNSINNSQLTLAGITKPSNFTPYQPGYYSYQLNGSTDYLQFPASSNFAYGTGDFTIESWVYVAATPPSFGSMVWSQTTTGVNYFMISVQPALTVICTVNGTDLATTGTTIKLNSWNHIAVTRTNGTLRIFINGTSAATPTSQTYNFTNTTYVPTIGRYSHAASNYLTGYVSNFRVVNGLSLYSSNFTPSTTPLLSVPSTTLLTAQSNKFVDNSPINAVVTLAGTPKISSVHPFTTQYQANTATYSYYFDGASYLSDTLGSSVTIGTSDFCLEGWGYWTSFNNGTYGAPIISLMGATAGELMIRANKTAATTTSANWFNIVGSGTYIPSAMYNSGVSGGTLYLNRWHHLAVSRRSGVWSFFVDGQRVSTTSAGDASLTLPFTTAYIGSDGNGGGGYMTGQVSSIRLTVGDYVYDGASYTPSTTPLTATANTKLLTAQDGTFKDNSGYSTHTYSASSTAIKPLAVSPFTPAYYSNYFSTGDYLVPSVGVPTTGDFTVECWFNVAGGVGARGIFSFNSVAIGYAAVRVEYNNALTIYISGDGASWAQTLSGGTLTDNTWYHLAVVKQGTTMTAYVNGTSIASGAVPSTLMAGTPLHYIGTSTDDKIIGFISNLRIVNQALYTGTFTPATAPLTKTSVGTSGANVAASLTGTVSLLTCQSPYFTDNSGSTVTITQTGTPKIAAVAPFPQPTVYSSNAVSTTLGSGYFNGTSDYLSIPTPLDFPADFTVEAWVYQTTYNSGTYQPVFANSFLFYIGSSGQVLLYNGTADVVTGTAGDVPINQWCHVAWVRSGTTVKIYVNGIQKATGTVSGSIGNGGPNRIAGYSTNYFPGYIADTRISKGTALYTSNFVPPTGQLTNA